MNELANRWRTYHDRVIPRDAPALQFIECRRAYYAGAQAVADILHRLQHDGSTEQQQRQALDDLITEIRLFQLLVQGDRA